MPSFTIIIKPLEIQRYTIEAIGPHDLNVKPQPFMWQPTATITHTLSQLADANSRVTGEEIEQLGLFLYDALFSREIAVAYSKAVDKVGAQNLRLRLQIEPPELAALPWESMRSEQGWLALDSHTPLVRLFLDRPHKFQRAVRSELKSLEVNKPLRVLFVGASPSDLAPLKVEAQFEGLQSALAESSRKKDVALTPLFHPSRETLRQELLKNYHVIYFAGHGDPAQQVYDDLDEKFTEIPAVIYINDRDGQASGKYGLTAQELAEMMKGPRNQVRLVFLAACNTSAIGVESKSSGDFKSPDDSPKSPDDSSKPSAILAGFAQDLTSQANLPAMIAMQYFISDQQAIPLTAHFFAAIAQFNPVDVALAQARNVMARPGQPLGRDVFAPVLYLQAENAALFKRAWNRAALALAALLLVVVVIAGIGGVFMEGQRATEEQARLAAQTNEAVAMVTAAARGTSEAIALVTGQAEAERANREAAAKAVEQARADTEEKAKATAQAQEKEQSKRVLARKLASEAELLFDAYIPDIGNIDTNPVLGTLLAIESMKRYPSLVSDQALRRGLSFLPQPVVYELKHNNSDLGYSANKIMSMSFNIDGSLLASSSRDGTTRVWDINTGQEIYRYLHQSMPTFVDFSPDNKWLAIANMEGKVLLVDPNTGNVIHELLHAQEVHITTFTPNGQWLITVSDSTVKVWDVLNQKELVQLFHNTIVNTLIVSPDSQWLATTEAEGKVSVWEIETGTLLDNIGGIGNEIHKIAFSANGWNSGFGILAVANKIGLIQLWHVSSNGLVKNTQIDNGSQVKDLVFSSANTPDGGSLLAVGGDKLRIWTNNGQPVILADPGMEIKNIAFSPDGSLLATGNAKAGKYDFGPGQAQLWEAATGRLLSRISHQSEVHHVVFSPNGQLVASASTDGTIKIWSTNNGQEFFRSVYGDPGLSWFYPSIAFTKDNSWLVMQGNVGDLPVIQNELKILELEKGIFHSLLTFEFTSGNFEMSANKKYLAIFGSSKKSNLQIYNIESQKFLLNIEQDIDMKRVSFSPDSQFLLAQGESIMQMWNINNLEQPWAIDNTNIGVFSPDGKWLATNNINNHIVSIWEVDTQKEIAQIDSGGSMEQLLFNVDSQVLAIQDADKKVTLWNIRNETRTNEYVFEGTLGVFLDNNRLATIGGGDESISDYKAWIWNVTTGEKLVEITQENLIRRNPYKRWVFSPDGQWVASGRVDGLLRLWDTNTGQEMGQMQHAKGIVDLVFSHDGKWLASAGNDETVRVWRWKPEDLIFEACRRLSRNLTQDEWEQYLGNEPYSKTCSDLLSINPSTTIANSSPIVIQIKEPKYTPTPISVPTNTGSTVIFSEDLYTSKLDAQRWKAIIQAGGIEIGNGLMSLHSTGRNFPFVYLTQDLFAGDFKLSVSVRYSNVTDRGVGFRIGQSQATYGASQETDINELYKGRIIEIWQDTSNWRVSVGTENTYVYTLPAPDFSNHKIEILYNDKIYNVYVDDQKVYESGFTETRPNVFWFGNPAQVDSEGEWSTLEISDITLQKLDN